MTYRTLTAPTMIAPSHVAASASRTFGMATQMVTPEYLIALDAFKNRLSESPVKPAAFPTAFAISVQIDAGRKFDRVLVGFAYVNDKGEIEQTPQEVWYFVDRFDGTIYGKKSDVAPNTRWWFGTIYTASDWKWTERCASPLHPEQFEKVGHYGEFTHYRPMKKEDQG